MLRIVSLLCVAILWTLPAAAQGVPDELVARVPDRPDGKLSEILARGRLVVGVKTDYAPWGVRRADGTIEGLEVDLARDLAERLGVGLELIGVTANNRIDRVNQGRVDVVIATTGDTAERRMQADLIQPNYYSSGVVVYGRRDLPVEGWADLRGARLCLNRSAYYNRALEETYEIEGRYFAGRREALLGLKSGRCDGWAFDDTALERYTRDNPSETFGVMVEPILEIPWAILVARGEGDRSLGRFLSDMVAEWHASGRILALQDAWRIPRTAYVAGQHDLWRTMAADRPACARDPETGAHPAACLDLDPYRSSPDVALTGWMATLERATGLNLAAFASEWERSRLLRGVGLTLALSATSILGALAVGVGLALSEDVLGRRGALGRILLLPQRALVTVARMTPPILQLYIAFFGLGGVFLAAPELTPGAFVIACAVFSLYAGASNAVMLSHGMAQVRAARPAAAAPALLPAAIGRSFDGLIAACVNIVKAAGLASAIAVPELVSSVNLTVAEGGDATTLMNGLLVFYFLLVTAILWLFRGVRARVVSA
ncbi:MAG: transporter substrate-binding domain-containing protein [Pseudomonadota bacterium]